MSARRCRPCSASFLERSAASAVVRAAGALAATAERAAASHAATRASRAGICSLSEAIRPRRCAIVMSCWVMGLGVALAGANFMVCEAGS